MCVTFFFFIKKCIFYNCILIYILSFYVHTLNLFKVQVLYDEEKI